MSIRSGLLVIGTMALCPLAGTAATAQTILPMISVTAPIAADQFATVTVVPYEELLRSNGATLADVLLNKPGITGSSFAPGAASRPIIRGLDNYRVRIQENGLATNDVSDLSEDHAVPIDPLAAQRIEVVRGPATLRYGSQAIGGVVNVDNNRIPTWLPTRPFELDVRGATNSVDQGIDGSVAIDAGAGNVAFHADAHGRRAADYGIPGYPYLFPPAPAPEVSRRQPNSAASSNGQSIGGSVVFDSGFIGMSVTQFNSLYRLPGIAATDTNTRVDLKQTKVNGKGEFRPASGPVEALRFWLGASDYKHDELANENGFDGVQQSFINRAQEGRAEVQFAPFDLRFGALATAIGVQANRQELAAPGGEGGLFDPNQSRNVAAFIFNELRFNQTQRLQLAGRIESARVDGTGFAFPSLVGGIPGLAPVGSSANLSFVLKSASIGLLQDLPWGIVGSVTAQHVERAPRAPELFSRGAHEATATFEIGNPNLTIESAQSFEVGLRRARGQLRFEATAYHTQFSNFIFKAMTGNRCDGDFESCGTGTEFNQILYSQRDATFRGVELQAQLDVAPLGSGTFGVDGQYDFVRATFSDGSNVPRVPPQRVGGGVFWRDANWFARVGLLHAAAQNDLAAIETPTGAYDLLKAELSHVRSFNRGFGAPREVTLGIVGDNLLDAEVRNHVSFKKNEVLLPGRNVRGFARVTF